MYYVLLNEEIQKTFDARKLASLAKAGFYICKSYIDAIIYSRAVLARGELACKSKYFESDDILLA